MQFKEFTELVEPRRFRHLGKRLGELLFGMKEVAEFVIRPEPSPVSTLDEVERVVI